MKGNEEYQYMEGNPPKNPRHKTLKENREEDATRQKNIEMYVTIEKTLNIGGKPP